jgi:hypothetical protein
MSVIPGLENYIGHELTNLLTEADDRPGAGRLGAFYWELYRFAIGCLWNISPLVSHCHIGFASARPY